MKRSSGVLRYHAPLALALPVPVPACSAFLTLAPLCSLGRFLGGWPDGQDVPAATDAAADFRTAIGWQSLLRRAEEDRFRSCGSGCERRRHVGSGWLIEEWVSEEDEGKGMMLVALGAMSMSILIRRSLRFAVVELALASDTVQVGRHLRELRANLGGKLGRE